ncbi:hypothetical protein [Clostridium botulinum]|nr:hypothetical protein [Clostridium botulinum]
MKRSLNINKLAIKKNNYYIIKRGIRRYYTLHWSEEVVNGTKKITLIKGR